MKQCQCGQGNTVNQWLCGHGKTVNQCLCGHGNAVNQCLCGHVNAVQWINVYLYECSDVKLYYIISITKFQMIDINV